MTLLDRHYLSNDVIRQLKRAHEDFVGSFCSGVEEYQRNEFVGDAAARELLEELDSSTRTIPYFEDSKFKDLVYRSFELARNASDSIELEEPFSRLDAQEQEIFCELNYDFQQFSFNESRQKGIELSVDNFLNLGECGKALKVVRECARFLTSSFCADLRSRAWSLISRVDPRFDSICDGFRGLAGLGGRFLFSLDRPYYVSGFDQRDHLRNIETEFVASTIKGIEEFGQNQQLESEPEALKLLAKLPSMKHFEKEGFRDYLLLSWRDLSGSMKREEVESLREVASKLTPAEEAIADEVVGDFVQPISASETPLVEDEVQKQIRKRDFTKAFWILRNSHLGAQSSSQLFSYAWRNLAMVHSDIRFNEIADAYEAYNH